MSVRECPECGYKSPPHGEKYCKMCKGKVVARMRRDGYFTTVPRRAKLRPPDAQEDTRETNSGIDDETI